MHFVRHGRDNNVLRSKQRCDRTYRSFGSATRRRRHPRVRIWWRTAWGCWDEAATRWGSIWAWSGRRSRAPSAAAVRCTSWWCRTAASIWRSPRRSRSSRIRRKGCPGRRTRRPERRAQRVQYGSGFPRSRDDTVRVWRTAGGSRTHSKRIRPTHRHRSRCELSQSRGHCTRAYITLRVAVSSRHRKRVLHCIHVCTRRVQLAYLLETFEPFEHESFRFREPYPLPRPAMLLTAQPVYTPARMNVQGV